MPTQRSEGGFDRQSLENFRALQEEMLSLSREYGRARQEAWAQETAALRETWNDFSDEWQGSLQEMAALAEAKFADITARGEAAGETLSLSLKGALAETSGEVEDWSARFLADLDRVSTAWSGLFGGRGGGDDWAGFLAPVIGGLFHQGGVVAAHQGLVVSPDATSGEEQLILAQSGEGILPRESMARLGEPNFEALRSGRFALAPAAAPRYDITIQVQSLESGAAALDWDRLVQRHILPALERTAGRGW